MSIKTTLEQIGAAAQKLKNEATAGGSQMHYIGDVIGDLVEVTEQIHSQMENGSVSDDELAAIQGANSPNATNSFATMNDLSDISGLSIQSAVVVETTSNAKTNGAALIAAYTAAKALTPNGAALSATNRACVIIPPGNYDLDHGEDDACVPLTLDTEFVDIIGLTTDRSLQQIYGTPEATNSGVIVQTADDVHVSNLYVKILTEVESANWNDTDSAAYFPSTSLSNTVVDNCQFDGQDGSTDEGPRLFSMRLYIEYSGTFNNCTGGNFAFGGKSTASGTFTNCTGGAGAFGGDEGTASGTFTNCTGGNSAFGGAGGTASGTFTNCTGGDFAFGGGGTASGTFKYCTGGYSAFGGYGTASGTFNYCTGGNFAFGGGSTASGTFNYCTGGYSAFGGSGGTASGTFTNCTGGNNAFGYGGTASGVFTNCTGGADAFGGNGGTLSGQLYYCRLTTGSFQTLAEGGKLRACVDGSDAFIATLDYEGQE